MKTEVLRVAMRQHGVTVLALDRREIPLKGLLAHGLAAFRKVRLDPALLGTPLDEADAMNGLFPLHLDQGPAWARGRRGLVVADNVARGLEFLLEHWVPRGRQDPDEAIREVRTLRRSRAARVEALLDRLSPGEEVEVDEDAWFHAPRRRRDRDASRSCRFVLTQAAFGSRYTTVSTPQGPCFLPKAADDDVFASEGSDMAVILERTEEVRGHPIPRWDVMRYVARSRPAPIVQGCWRGHRFHGPLARQDARMLDQFEAHGRVVSVTEGDLLAAETLRARFLVKVPPMSQGRAFDRVPDLIGDLPGALMSDSRNPVPVPEDIPVIDDPAEAKEVVARINGGVFLPDASPEPIPSSFAGLEGAWLVGSLPAGRLP